MKRRPILFSTPMVRAILDGRKTQTRRVIKPQPEYSRLIGPTMYAPTVIDRDGFDQPGAEIYGVYSEDGEWGVRCPYGRPGDRLWVKETFCQDDGGGYHYRATEADTIPGLTAKWTPSIYMPRAASRLELEVADIRVQRIQEISYEDAVAEGIYHEYPKAWAQFRDLWDSINAKPRPRQDGSYYVSFPWDAGSEVTEHRGRPWYVEGNPWVWVVEF